MKETYYFSHDYNAIQDPKMMALLYKCGLEGIGIYWILIELLHQQPDSKLDYKSYCDFIDFYGRMDGENEQLLNKIKQVLIDIGLFVQQDNFIFSKRVLENKKQREILSEKRSLAGKKSAEIRKKGTSVQQKGTSVQQGKERKGKEIKINNNIVNTSTIVEEASPSEFGKPEINNLLKEFETIMGFKSTSGKKDRMMATHLLKNYTSEQLTYMLKYCATEQYAPRIGSLEKLWYKRGDIIAGIKSSQNNKIQSL